MSLNLTDAKEIKKFGVTAFILFGCLCALGVWLEKYLPTCLFGTLSALGLGLALFPNRLRPVFAAWLTTGRFLGRIVTILILTLAYYLVITPASLVKRIFGGVPLPLKPDKNISSYWVARKEGVQSKEQFLNRF